MAPFDNVVVDKAGPKIVAETLVPIFWIRRWRGRVLRRRSLHRHGRIGRFRRAAYKQRNGRDATKETHGSPHKLSHAGHHRVRPHIKSMWIGPPRYKDRL